ncbi:amidohydrolase [Fodinicurvata sp. EGI_FJ10296]|uniref:amidohydrolase family protein n=1 Tax=Fodinicurvata sp. EGI_FJ10296 TaxID=3231908 RepID=UPI003456AFD7
MTDDKTILRGARVLDPLMSEPAALDILVQGDTIVDLLAPGEAVSENARVVDLSGHLVHPGLVNAHTHAHGSMSKGMGDRWTLELLLTAAPWVGGNRTEEDKFLTAQLGAAEMLMKGCTAAYDMFFEFPVPSVDGMTAVGRAYDETGMRAVVAPMIADRTFFQAIPGLIDAMPEDGREAVRAMTMAPAETTLANVARVLENWAFDRDRIRPALAPTIPHHCTDDFLTGTLTLARDHDVAIQTHLLESKVQALTGMKVYGHTLARHMAEMGFFDGRFTAAHGVWLDPEDMALLGDHGCSVSHNPGSNLRLGSGIADTRRMLDLGVNLGIGTDGANCSDNLNMYEAMRMAALVSRVCHLDPGRWISTAEAFRAATIGSARSLGMESTIGRIAPGYKADLVALSLRHPNWMPLNNAINQLVLTEDGTAVRHVMVGGRMVVSDGVLLTVDFDALYRRLDDARERLEVACRDNEVLFYKLEKAVASFCPGLAATPYHVDRHCIH